MFIESNHKEFLLGIWEKEASVLQGAYATPPIDAEELYEAVKTLWAKKDFEDINPYIDGRNPFPTEYTLFEPTEANFADYCAAVSERVGGVPFGAQILHIERHCDSLRNKLGELAGMLAKEHGMPAGYFNGGAFFGNYSETPFGIHTDPAAITTWPVLGGSKRVLVWPDSYFDDNPQNIPIGRSHKLMLDNLEQYRKDAQVLEAKPGDLMYWPSSHWHMAQGEHGIHATVSLSYYYWNSFSRMVARAVEADLEKQLGDRCDVWGSWTLDQEFPDGFTAAIGALKKTVDGGVVNRVLQEHWNAYVANGGFSPVD